MHLHVNLPEKLRSMGQLVKFGRWIIIKVQHLQIKRRKKIILLAYSSEFQLCTGWLFTSIERENRTFQ